jgi:hypothetical protein
MAEIDMTHPEPADAPMHAVPDPLPASVQVAGDAPLRFTPNELAMIRAQTGQTITDLLDGDDRWRVIAWLRLRRIGYPGVQWDQLGDLEIELVVTATAPAPDPTVERSSMISPRSAGTGA